MSSSSKDTFLCPVCQSKIQANLKSQIGFFAHLQITFVVAAICTLFYFFDGLEMALKVSLLYLPIWGVVEFFHWMQVRNNAICPTCDFDTFLYVRDVRRARTRIETRLNNLESVAKEKIDKRKQLVLDERQKNASSEAPLP